MGTNGQCDYICVCLKTYLQGGLIIFKVSLKGGLENIVLGAILLYSFDNDECSQWECLPMTTRNNSPRLQQRRLWRDSSSRVWPAGNFNSGQEHTHTFIVDILSCSSNYNHAKIHKYITNPTLEFKKLREWLNKLLRVTGSPGSTVGIPALVSLTPKDFQFFLHPTSKHIAGKYLHSPQCTTPFFILSLPSSFSLLFLCLF